MGSAEVWNYTAAQRALIQLAREHGLRVMAPESYAASSATPLAQPFNLRLQTAKAWLRASEIRRNLLTEQLGADPAWDILLDLYVNQHAERPVSISSACIASGVPMTTALRWIQQLVDRKWVVRQQDDKDARKAYLLLTLRAKESIDSALDAAIDSDWRYGLQRMNFVESVDRSL